MNKLFLMLSILAMLLLSCSVIADNRKAIEYEDHVSFRIYKNDKAVFTIKLSKDKIQDLNGLKSSYGEDWITNYVILKDWWKCNYTGVSLSENKCVIKNDDKRCYYSTSGYYYCKTGWIQVRE